MKLNDEFVHILLASLDILWEVYNWVGIEFVINCKLGCRFVVDKLYELKKLSIS